MLPHILSFLSLYTAFKHSTFYCNYLAPNLTCNKPKMNLCCFFITAVASVLFSKCAWLLPSTIYGFKDFSVSSNAESLLIKFPFLDVFLELVLEYYATMIKLFLSSSSKFCLSFIS